MPLFFYFLLNIFMNKCEQQQQQHVNSMQSRRILGRTSVVGVQLEGEGVERGGVTP